METQGSLRFKGANEKVSSSTSKPDKMHITAKGKEGRALRKRLAIAMGLRISSSGTPSTIDSDEELELPGQELTSQNVMEMFRKQMKETAAKKKNTSSQQQPSDQFNNEMFRKTVYRRTTTTTREFLSDEDDMDEQERSMDHVTRTANARKSHDISKHQEFSESSQINKQLTEQQDKSTRSVSTNNNTSSAEEIFSSYGEQDDSSSSVIKTTADDSVKLLRERIRRNARARRLPTPKGSGAIEDKEKEDGREEKRESYQLIQRKISSSSQIPVLIERKTSDARATKTSEEEGQNSKSKIPRRKSQNVNDRKETLKKNDSGFSESQLSEFFSTNDKNERNSSKIKIDGQQSRRDRNFNTDIVGMNTSQELFSSENSSLFDLPTEKVSKKSKPVSAVKVKNVLRELRASEHDASHTGKSSSKTTSHKKGPFDFDAILAELADLKASVFKTYDDLHEMNEYTSGLRKELKEMRNI